MLTVAVASADAEASREVGDCGLPQSFSKIEGLLAAATDITAALARRAMSRTAAPGFFADRASVARGGAGAIAAIWTGADGSELSFGCVASASFGVSACAAGSTDCGAAAANRSSNESNGRDGTLPGAEIIGAGSGKAATMVSASDGALLTTSTERLTTGESKLALLSCG